MSNPAFLGALVVALSLTGCSRPADPAGEPVFQHRIDGASTPWTQKPFDDPGDRFTFAVFSDLTGGERPRVFEIAVAQLNLLRPELVLNVGDLIEGSTENLAEIDAQWDSFDQRAGRAIAPVFYVGGNHDLTGKVLQDAWDQRYGRRYYHFVYKNTLFLVLDAEDNTDERAKEIFELRNLALKVADEQGWDAFGETEYANLPENQAGNIGAEQSQYFLKAIADNGDVRWTFLFMHKAPWLREDMTTFAAIEGALAGRPYTLFHGHQHAYAYQQRNGRDYIQLATTGGVQLPDKGRSMDHVMLVTVSDEGVDIANLHMSGILDKTGQIPLDGDTVCFESTRCDDQAE